MSNPPIRHVDVKLYAGDSLVLPPLNLPSWLSKTSYTAVVLQVCTLMPVQVAVSSPVAIDAVEDQVIHIPVLDGLNTASIPVGMHKYQVNINTETSSMLLAEGWVSVFTKGVSGV